MDGRLALTFSHFYTTLLWTCSTEFIFGTSTDSQLSSGTNTDTSQSGSFQYHWDAAATYFEIRALLGSRCWLYNPAKFQEHCRGIHAFAGQLVKDAIARKQKQGLEKSEKDSGKFVLVDELAEVLHDPDRLRDECLNVLGAGRTSTAALIQWCFFYLARYSDTYSKLRKILVSQFGDSADEGKITYDGLRQCNYRQCCISECTRLTPVKPVHIRLALRDTVLSQGGGADGQAPIFVKAPKSANPFPQHACGKISGVMTLRSFDQSESKTLLSRQSGRHLVPDLACVWVVSISVSFSLTCTASRISSVLPRTLTSTNVQSQSP